MVYLWQQAQWQKTVQQIQANKLPHALLLTGPEGLGKYDFALQLSHALLCQSTDDQGHACGSCSACQLIQAGTHPDFFVLQAEEKGKTIKVDSIRQLNQNLQLTSQYSGYKVAVIVDAHDMNINASNSLLKTLEEPAQGSVIILVSSRPHKLPITIRSRSQSIHFSVPQREQSMAWLETQSVNGDEASLLLDLAHGAPLLARQLGDSELMDAYKQLISALLAVSKNQPVVAEAEQLHKLPLGYMLNWLQDWVQDLIKLVQCGENTQLVHSRYKKELLILKARCQLSQLFSYLDQLIQNKKLQSIPLNTQLLWEDLLLSWNKQLK